MPHSDQQKTLWKCEAGHVLGYVERRHVDGYHVTVLLELRQAIDLDDPGEVELSGVLEGGKQIICSICRKTRYFSPSEAALERFMARRKKKELTGDIQR